VAFLEDDSGLRVRLEGRAELLEAAVLRYGALVGALKSFRWKRRLQKLSDVARAVAVDEEAVDEALGFVARRAESEAWPRGPVLAAAAEAEALRGELRKRVQRRLGDAAPAPAPRGLGASLEDLVELARASPQLVLPGQRWEVACAALPAQLAELQAAQRFGASLERVFNRPMEPRGVLQVTPSDWAEVEPAWNDGVRALDELWRRVEALDLTGGVGRMLRRKAKRPARPEPKDGPTLLVYAEYWRALAASRMEHIARTRVEPAVLRPGEALLVFGWLLRRQAQADAALGLAPARAGLLELAHLLSGSSHAPAQERPWDALEALAARADSDAQDPDWRRVRDALFILVRVAATPTKWLPPVHRKGAPAHASLHDAPLLELVKTLRVHLGGPPPTS